MNATIPSPTLTRAPGSLFDRHERRLVRYAFLTVYLVWGVSFAVGRIMATNLPPVLAAGVRFLFAGVLLTAMVYARGLSLPARAGDWRRAGTAALLGVVLSNGLNMLALRHVASNQVALISASSAFWIAWLGMYGRQASPVSARTWAGLAVGFIGVAVLVSAHAFGSRAQLGWQLVALGSALAWGLATAVIRESQRDSDPVVFTASYVLLGGVALTILGLAGGDAARWSWSIAGLAAIAFLAIFSSTLTYHCLQLSAAPREPRSHRHVRLRESAGSSAGGLAAARREPHTAAVAGLAHYFRRSDSGA